MNFTASSNILLDNSNSLTTSSLDGNSKRVFTCNRNEMSTRDKTHRRMKKKFCLHYHYMQIYMRYFCIMTDIK